MRILEYVEIREEQGQPVWDHGAIEVSANSSKLADHILSGVRVYALSDKGELHSRGMHFSTMVQIFPHIPRLLSGLISHAGGNHLDILHTSEAIAGFYAADPTHNPVHLRKKSAASLFSAASVQPSDLIIEVDTNSSTIMHFIRSFESIMLASSEASRREPYEDEYEEGLPSELKASVEKRKELLKEGWPTSGGVAHLLGSTADNKSQQAAFLRKTKKLLGVRDGAHGFRHPLCQFKEGEPIPQMESLLRILPPGNGSGWSQAFWLYSPHPMLRGKRPADVLQTRPDNVIKIARQQFEAPRHAGW